MPQPNTISWIAERIVPTTEISSERAGTVKLSRLRALMRRSQDQEG
jgi:hypothetical protein